MKKTYKTPSMRVGELDAQDLLCASPMGVYSNIAAQKDDDNDATQGSGLVKGKNLWDEEW